MDGQYFGIFIDADDILLLSARRIGVQYIVDICARFTTKKNLKFGVNPKPEKSNTKCISFSTRDRNHQNLQPIMLDGLLLPWVEKLSHLRNTLDSAKYLYYIF